MAMGWPHGETPVQYPVCSFSRNSVSVVWVTVGTHSTWNCTGMLQPSWAHRNDIRNQSLSAWGLLRTSSKSHSENLRWADTCLHSGHAAYNQSLSLGHHCGCGTRCRSVESGSG